MTSVESQPSQLQAIIQNPLTRPPLLLRAEGLALLAISVAAYLVAGGHWGYLFSSFLADLTFIGYYANARFYLSPIAPSQSRVHPTTPFYFCEGLESIPAGFAVYRNPSTSRATMRRV